MLIYFFFFLNPSLFEYFRVGFLKILCTFYPCFMYLLDPCLYLLSLLPLLLYILRIICLHFISCAPIFCEIYLKDVWFCFCLWFYGKSVVCYFTVGLVTCGCYTLSVFIDLRLNLYFASKPPY